MVIAKDTEMDLMTVNEVAEMLGLHPLTVRRKLNDRKIRAWKVDNLWRIPKSEVFRYLVDSTAKAFSDKER